MPDGYLRFVQRNGHATKGGIHSVTKRFPFIIIHVCTSSEIWQSTSRSPGKRMLLNHTVNNMQNITEEKAKKDTLHYSARSFRSE